MKLNQNKPASKSRVRFPIVLTSIPTLILTIIVILKFPEFIDRMSRAIENTEINGALNETGTTSSFEVLLLLIAIFAAIVLWVYLIRLVKSYKRLHLQDDQRLINTKQYSKLFKIWMNE
jgi:hypothetical protein